MTDDEQAIRDLLANAYRDGVASMDMRLLSLVPVAKKTGGGLNQGDLLRFLGELQWFPAPRITKARRPRRNFCKRKRLWKL